MARARNIKPAFFKNESLGMLGVEAAYFFEGLWTQADRDGILENRPMRLKIEICPYWNWDVEAIIESLEKTGFVRCYTVAGINCISIINFTKHQNPHNKEVVSDLPRPPADVSDCSAKSLLISGQAQGKTGTSRADSLNLIPDSLLGDKPPKKDIRFEDFWKAYPKKNKKVDTRKIWLRGKTKAGTKIDFDAKADELIADIRARLKQDRKWIDGYSPDPTTYLNGERWTDAMDAPASPASQLKRPPETDSKTWLKLCDQYGVSTRGKQNNQLWAEIQNKAERARND